jgi:hypothetical protein
MGITRVVAVVLALVPAMCAGLAATTSGGEESFGLRWSWVEISKTLGVLDTGDLDGDGAAEVLFAGCGGYCWVVVTRGAEGYQQLRSSVPIEYQGITRMVEIPGTGRSAIVDARNGQLTLTEWVDGAPSSRLLPLLGEDLQDFQLADLDGDGDLELLSINAFDLFVQDWLTGAHIVTRFGFGGTSLEMGSIDADPAPEIGVASGSGSCWVLDGATLAVDWATPSGCGDSLRFGRLLGAQTDQVVSAQAVSNWDFVLRAWNPPVTVPLHESGLIAGRSPVVAVGDLDGTVGDEIVLADLDNLTIRILNGQSGSLIEAVEAGESVSIDVADTDGDGELEIVRSGSPYGTLPVDFSILAGSTRELEYQAPYLRLESLGADVADLDGDGDLELVVGGGSVDPSTSDWTPEALVLPAAFGTAIVQRPLGEADSGGGHVGDVRAADIDVDGDIEVCATAIGGSTAACYEGRTFAQIWRTGVPGSSGRTLLADIQGDASVEMVMRKAGPDESAALTAIQAANGWPLWTTPPLGLDYGSVPLLCLGDFTKEPGDELLAAGLDGRGVVRIDPATGAVFGGFEIEDSGVMACGDVDADGRTDLIVGLWNGTVAFVDVATGTVGAPLFVVEDSPHQILVGDLLGDPQPEFVVRLYDALQIRAAPGGAVIWSIEDFAGYAGGLRILDVDADGRNELISIRSGQLLVFGLPYVGSPLLIDGFESGDVGQWSRAAY